jgi:hypothetical protein
MNRYARLNDSGRFAFAHVRCARWPCKANPSMSPSLADFVAVQGYFSEVQEQGYFSEGQEYVANSRPINRLSKI